MMSNEKIRQRWAIVLTGAAIVSTFVAYQDMRWIGFPDGFVTEWDRIRKILLYVFMAINLPFAIAFVRFGFGRSSDDDGKKLRWAGMLWIAAVVCCVIANVVLRRYSGRGG